jgi:hypothetical protein
LQEGSRLLADGLDPHRQDWRRRRRRRRREQ